MKTIIKSCALALGIGALTTGCADFVNIIPKDLVTEENFWDEKADVDQMVAGVYYKMQSDPMMRRYIVWGELRSDNIYIGKDTQTRDGSVYEILRENILSTNAYTTWVEFYNVINTCNQIIEMAPVVGEKDPTYTASNVSATIAEVTALRSLMYFYLIRAFKDVPYYRHAVTSEDQVFDIAATSFDVILSDIINDCETVLPNAIKVYTSTKDNTGRITQNAIHAMLADMYLWQGNYAKCIEHSNAVIASFCEKYYDKRGGSSSTVIIVNGASASLDMVYNEADEGVDYSAAQDGSMVYRGYPLYVDSKAGSESSKFGGAFNTIFDYYGGSRETIFELAFTPENGTAYVANEACGFFYGENKPKDSNQGKGAIAPNKRLFESNNEDFWPRYDVRRYCVMEVDKDGTEAWIRKYASCYNSVDKTKANTAAGISTANEGNYSYSSTQNYDWIFYRLTDVMLMKAEAIIEQLDENPQTEDEIAANEAKRMEAFNIIYAVNKRSCMDDSKQLKADGYGAKARMQDLVQEERRKELMFEGKRWFDLVRITQRKGTGQAVKDLAALVKTKFDLGTGGSVMPNMESLYLPYSKHEVKTNALLEQKPYWASQEKSETTTSTAK